ncbi:aminoglycoside adenylyltransferase domain-containing protein [Methylobacterium oxalidis]|uniref:aminoglycoside adenylyltransferase domain-containing protein n=1 Tax=Methylobacterium oxalidis TaxID=944322 RepID=UPI003315ABDC
MTVHLLARRTAEAHLAMADAATPDLIEALYLIGSAAMNDFRLSLSNVDFVAVVRGRPDQSTLTALSEVHARLSDDPSLPDLDGIYVTWDELRVGPLVAPDGPFVRHGRLHVTGCHERHPATWNMLNAHAATVRGPLCAGTLVWRDPAELEAWLLTTIETLWCPWLEEASKGHSAASAAALEKDTVERVALGMCRLHYTLATGSVPSKSDAGLYGLITFPRKWHPIIDEALRIRREPDAPSFYVSRNMRRSELLGFVHTVLVDALAMHSGGPQT